MENVQKLIRSYTVEPPHDKTNKMTVRPAKTQISLGIRPVWSESSLCAQWIGKDQSFLHADSEDSDQTGRMPRLIWDFAVRTTTLLVLSWGGSIMLLKHKYVKEFSFTIHRHIKRDYNLHKAKKHETIIIVIISVEIRLYWIVFNFSNTIMSNIYNRPIRRFNLILFVSFYGCVKSCLKYFKFVYFVPILKQWHCSPVSSPVHSIVIMRGWIKYAPVLYKLVISKNTETNLPLGPTLSSILIEFKNGPNGKLVSHCLAHVIFYVSILMLPISDNGWSRYFFFF